MTNICIVGGAWGDEGKGKIVVEEILEEQRAGKTVYNGRWQGGANAGHSIYIRINGVLHKFVAHASPSGAVCNANLFIGPDVAYDSVKFVKETKEARERFGFNSDILISERTGILFDYHISLDMAQELSRARQVGTTGSGIGTFYMDNSRRTTRLVFADYVSPNFKDRLKSIFHEKRDEFNAASGYLLASAAKKEKGDEKNQKIADEHRQRGERLCIVKLNTYLDELISQHEPVIEELKHCGCQLEYVLNRALSRGDSIVLEGAQGTMLDVNAGTLPDVTSSHLLAQNGITSVGLPRRAFKIYVVEKVYPTRVGNGVMPTLAGDDFGVETQKNGGEQGATTGRLRRVGYPDWVVSAYAAMMNDADGFILTRVDLVQDKELKHCVAYKRPSGEISNEMPLDLSSVKPVYSERTHKWHLWDGPTDLSDPLKVDEILRPLRERYVKGDWRNLPRGFRDYCLKHNEHVFLSTGRAVPIVAASISPVVGERVVNHHYKD